MRYMKIPVEGNITVETQHGDFAKIKDTENLLGKDRVIEQVRFGLPYSEPPQQFTYGNEGALVMLVDEDGIRLGLMPNPRASLLYRVGDRHQGVIYGDALICLSRRDRIEGDEWDDVPDDFAVPGYWEFITTPKPVP